MDAPLKATKAGDLGNLEKSVMKDDRAGPGVACINVSVAARAEGTSNEEARQEQKSLQYSRSHQTSSEDTFAQNASGLSPPVRNRSA